MGTLITATAHGLLADDRVYLVNLVGGEGLDSTVLYYVLASGLTANQFAVSLTSGGAAVAYTTDVSDGGIVRHDVYTQVADGTMDAPTAITAPGSVTLSSAVVVAPDGTAITRLDITIVQPTTATLRHTIVTITGGSNTAKVVIPVGQTTGSIASVVPGTSYTGTAISYDTFGLASGATASAAHTAAGDTSAPATPTGVQSSDGFRSWSVSWNANTEDDLDHYEIDWRVSGDPSYTGPIICYTTRFTYTPAFTSGTGTLYDVSIRAVDHTGNASAWTAVVNPIAYLLDGTDIYDGTITTTEIADSGITTPKLATNAVTADKIAANSVTVGKMAQNPNNEAANGGFEVLSTTAPAVDVFGAVSVSPFLGWSTGDTVARVAYTKTNVHGGGIAALIKANSVALARYKTEQVPVLGGRRYHFSYWYRGAAGNNAGATVQAFVREYDINGTQGFTTSFVNHVVGTTTTWANESGTCILDASTVAVDILIRNGGVATGDIVGADDIELYPADYDMSHAGGDVVINSSGITINNGKLTLQDEFGKTVQTASGFSGNWADFIQTGLYNGRFLQGTAGAIAAGRTSALPYWTLANTTGSPVATFVANGGVAVTFAALSNKKSFTSDAISVHPAAIYQSAFMVSINKAGGTLFLVLAPFIDWFQADGTASAITATTTLDTSSFSATLAATAINNLLPVRPPSDARFAKLRFTVEENAIGTHTVGNSLTLLSASLKEVGNTTTGRGAAFPTSPATNDHFYRTDLQFEFYFDGTRWLTTQMFQAGSGIEANTGTYTISFAATAARTMMANCVPPNVATDVWVDSITMGVEIASGGTALDASNKWVMTFNKGTALTPTTSIGSITINSGSSAVWRPTSVAIGALLGLANPVVSMDLTKTGTPGAFQIMSPFIVFYRIVTT